jgi:hypothetical protein
MVQWEVVVIRKHLIAYHFLQGKMNKAVGGHSNKSTTMKIMKAKLNSLQEKLTHKEITMFKTMNLQLGSKRIWMMIHGVIDL